jgi:hypothetical protein
MKIAQDYDDMRVKGVSRGTARNVPADLILEIMFADSPRRTAWNSFVDQGQYCNGPFFGYVD